MKRWVFFLKPSRVGKYLVSRYVFRYYVALKLSSGSLEAMTKKVHNVFK